MAKPLPKFKIYNFKKKIYADIDIVNYSEQYAIDTLGTVHKFKDSILLPSTGRYDCNNKEMYVGDIVKAYFVSSDTDEKGYDLLYVTSEDYAFGTKGMTSEHFVGFFEELDVPEDEYEIVGNIYEGNNDKN